MNLPEPFAAAMARLDAEIAAQRTVVTQDEAALASSLATLAELELKRQGAEVFLIYLGDTSASLLPTSVASSTPPPSASDRPRKYDGSPSGLIEKLIKESGLREFSNERVNRMVQGAGHYLTRTQVSNALTYLSRGNKPFLKSSGRRGQWELAETAPAPANADGPAEARPSATTSPPELELPSASLRVASGVRAG